MTLGYLTGESWMSWDALGLSCQLSLLPHRLMRPHAEKEWSFKLSLKGLGIGSSNSMYESKEVSERKTTESAEKADIFIATNASAIELTEIEKYKKAVVGDRPLVLWNLELDTLRADLGAWACSPPFSASRPPSQHRMGPSECETFGSSSLQS